MYPVFRSDRTTAFFIVMAISTIYPPGHLKAWTHHLLEGDGVLFQATPPLSDEDVFRACANSAAAAARLPAYVSYETKTAVRYSSITSHLGQHVRITNDRVSIRPFVRDDNSPDEKVASPMPMPGVYDTLSNFYLYVKISTGKPALVAYVTKNQPLSFDTRTAAERNVDVVTTTVKDYVIERVDDGDPGTSHLHLKLRPGLAETSNMFISEVKIDNESMLPREVVIQGSDGRKLTTDYAVIEGHWVVAKVDFHSLLPGPMGIGRVPGDFTTEYSNYSFEP